ncbi:MAG TPA: hypothetical protein PKH78_00470 [Candidatus Obscuribacter sp.]|nr:hypothetical protein [Candidatus Obscuribacter sp.]HNA71782.1 hypothetical protein [Candidatus Obscuribacter sp.]HND05921.1 hypothetical protein [Candidatus Obscuribacter sp.]HNN61477.1 hypothetical protein [Candidatus Obscuribacter sp.]
MTNQNTNRPPPTSWRRRLAQDPPPSSNVADSYFERLMRYIPADIVAGYVAIDGILKDGGNSPLWLTWSVFISLLVLTPLYVCYLKTVPPGMAISKTFHWVASMLAFSAWVFALGGPFAVTFDWYRPVYGSVLLILTTLTLPVLESIFYGGSPPTPPAVPTLPTAQPQPPEDPPGGAE